MIFIQKYLGNRNKETYFSCIWWNYLQIRSASKLHAPKIIKVSHVDLVWSLQTNWISWPERLDLPGPKNKQEKSITILRFDTTTLLFETTDHSFCILFVIILIIGCTWLSYHSYLGNKNSIRSVSEGGIRVLRMTRYMVEWRGLSLRRRRSTEVER